VSEADLMAGGHFGGTKGIITLTKHTPTPSSAAAPVIGAGAPEVTSAMIDAGVDAYLALDREFDAAERIVTEVFRAMAEVSQQPTPAAASSRQSVRQSHWWSL
jgi:hypothetical protein